MTIKRGLAVAAALAAASAGLVSAHTASAAPLAVATFAPAGTVAPSPASGTSTTAITLSPPGGASCAGDSVSGGYRWQTFMVPSTVDPSTIVFGANGPTGAGQMPLYNTSGSAVKNVNTGLNTGTGGLLTPIPLYDFGTSLPAAGKYWIGYACSVSGVTDKIWSGAITIGASSAYSTGWAPDAPVVSALTAGDGSLHGTFTEAAGNPAITGFTVTATPASGPVVTASLGAGATSFTVTGLTNGVLYSVTVGATNSVTTTTSSVVTGTPAPLPFAGATPFAAVGGAKSVVLNWTAPAGETQTRTGYTLTATIHGGAVVSGSPFTLAASAITYTLSDLSANTQYDFTLTATYAGLYTGTTVSTIATALDAQIIVQDVTVIRPVGALVLTQVCGEYGALPQRAATAQFPLLLTSTSGVTGSGTAPTTPTLGGTADGQFPSYPDPRALDTNPASPTYGQTLPAPTYPTHCGINLGEAKLITKDQITPILGATNNLAGQYFSAYGQLNQVTVLDARDVDSGWTLNATMSAFTQGSVTFSGNHLGWNPQVTHQSGNTFGEYSMTAAAGSAVQPMGAGLGTSQTLATAPVGHGLGIAQLDARLELLLPIWVKSGAYTGTLTFSFI
ncbi:MAG: fibronectin type III domain-containing protein [Actinomycetota bacterium]